MHTIPPLIASNRLLLRPWQDDDAPLLYRYASDPDVGPRAGWVPHQSVEESLHIIQTVFRNPTVDLHIAIQATLTLVIAGTLAGLFPARKATKIRPVEALNAN